MASFIIPTRGDLLNYDQSVTLDGVVFNLQFRFNQRDDAWTLNVLDESQNRIKSGIKLVANFPLLRLVRDLRRPAGELVSLDVRVLPAPPRQEELGDIIDLAYTDEAGVAEALSA